MQEYNVVFSETAEYDLDEVIEYLSNFSPSIARRYYDEIMVKALSLGQCVI
ncbi:MAG: type II toxin-antitoxin system RelE/ParE family toxin [Oscillospiraceae bacterium]|nr:type II toxin-antitoxin system RelE/ParE family toxin [Oscillospiraceae bacterium]